MTVRILGYTDRLSVRRGGALGVHVSAEADWVHADLVRLVGGPTPDAPHGFSEEPSPVSWQGWHPTDRHALVRGSFVRAGRIPALGTFTVAAWAQLAVGTGAEQALLGSWSPAGGWLLGVDADGTPFMRVAAGGRTDEIQGKTPLPCGRWRHVAATWDPAAGRSSLVVQADEPFVERWDARRAAISDVRAPAGEVLIGAVHRGSAHGSCFNGKLEAPAIWNRALDDASLRRVADDVAFDPVASWDFGAREGSWLVVDGERVAEIVNHPMAAVTGRRWRRTELDPRLAPDEYAALRFHDDDLDDARWPRLLSVGTEDLDSGIYAVRLRDDAGAEDRLPFVVAPREGDERARVAVLLPTYSYVVYANEHSIERDRIFDLTGVHVDPESPNPEDAVIRRERLLSCYDEHTDGSGACFSSWRRPLLTVRPGYVNGVVRGPHQLPADLCLIGWLHATGIPYEVITDDELHHEGERALAGHVAVLSGSHPEYWTGPMLDALESDLREGGRFAYLGGNGLYWVTGVDPHAPWVLEVRRGHSGTRSWESEPGEVHLQTTGEPGGLWRHRGRAPQRLVTVGMTAQGFDRAEGYARTERSGDPDVAWMFDGVDEEPLGAYGQILGGAAGHEMDRADTRLGTPLGAALVASSSGYSEYAFAVVEEVLAADGAQAGPDHPGIRSDMVIAHAPGGGAVFATGSIAWIGALPHNGYDNGVSRVTENVVRRFAEKGA